MRGSSRDQGFRGKEIADRPGISMGTVQTHIARIYDTLHVRSRAQGIIKAPRSSSARI